MIVAFNFVPENSVHQKNGNGQGLALQFLPKKGINMALMVLLTWTQVTGFSIFQKRRIWDRVMQNLNVTNQV